MAYRVVIVEDDTVALDRMVASVSGDPEMEVIGTAQTVRAGQQLISRLTFDALFVDLNLYGESGLLLIAQAKKVSTAKIIVVSTLGDERSVVDAIEAGADGYILKDGLFDGLPQSLRDVLQGGAPISPAVARHLLTRFHPSHQATVEKDPLSRRERQVLEALAQGYRYKEISERLNLSYHTISDYAKALYKKLRVNSRSQAVIKAAQEGLIQMPTSRR